MLNNPKNFIIGVAAEVLSEIEQNFILEHQPLGLILFKRNCIEPSQMKALVDSFKKLCSNYSPLILIDQEGGRVSRLPVKYYDPTPAMDKIIANKTIEEAYLGVYDNFAKIAQMLIPLGINVNCAPVADLLINGSDNVIGDRSFGMDPEFVSQMAMASSKALSDHGIQSVIKHIPGHGRANCDSHFELPRVNSSLELLEKTDFLVFKQLQAEKLAMTAHVVYEALDPNNCATVSPIVISYIRNTIGFNGIILTDDLSMKALSGSFQEKAAASLLAGCDILLHCNGKIKEMEAVAEVATYVSDDLMVKISDLACFTHVNAQEEL